MAPPTLPAPVAALAADLAGLPCVEAVALGGSRATGTHEPDSDWDLVLYYRGAFDPRGVAGLGRPGYVSALGEWGPIVHGGAWLTVEGLAVDVLFRDLAVVLRRLGDAEHGRFDIVAQNGHLAGAPTYASAGELALCAPLSGRVLRPAFPRPLAAAAPPRWEERARLMLLFAAGHAERGDAVACAGLLAVAVLCAGHARLAARGEWVLTEKGLVARAGLDEAQAVLAGPGLGRADLRAAVAAVGGVLGLAPLRVR